MNLLKPDDIIGPAQSGRKRLYNAVKRPLTFVCCLLLGVAIQVAYGTLLLAIRRDVVPSLQLSREILSFRDGCALTIIGAVMMWPVLRDGYAAVAGILAGTGPVSVVNIGPGFPGGDNHAPFTLKQKWRQVYPFQMVFLAAGWYFLVRNHFPV